MPRSAEENQCVLTVADSAWSWLGFTDLVTEGQFIGADGCGVVSSEDPAWASHQPTHKGGQHYLSIRPPLDAWPVGWYDLDGNRTHRALCQLAFCYQPHCPDQL